MVISLVGAANGALVQVANTQTINGVALDTSDARPKRLYWNDFSSTTGSVTGLIRWLDEDGNMGISIGKAGFQSAVGEDILATDPSVTANNAQFITVDANGDIYFGDQVGARVRRIVAATGNVTTFAGGLATSECCSTAQATAVTI